MNAAATTRSSFLKSTSAKGFSLGIISTIADVTFGVVHYCVTNMPGAVARTSTQALENSTLPFSLAIAGKGYKKALADDVHLRNGLNVIDGKVTYKAVADALGHKFVEAESAI